MRITKVGVVGAGSMGSGIAALAASAGCSVVLLDVPLERDRDAVARGALQRARTAKPAPFLDAAAHERIIVGNTEDHLDRLADCDWIVEAIFEQLEPKRVLFERLDALRRPDAIVASNTSGIPIHSLIEGRSDGFRSHFLGTHFFNPPRYLHLLEIIPTAATSTATLGTMRAFAERRLGKGVIIAKDVPGFIANRLGLYGIVTALQLMEEFGFDIDDVDALTGPLIGRPRSATFRTADVSGLDVVAHVVDNLAAATGEPFALPEWVRDLVRGGRLGEKSGAGFYRRVGKAIETLDWRTGEYRPKRESEFPELAFMQKLPLLQRLRVLTTAGGHRAEFVRTLLMRTAHYTLERTPELSYDIASIDRAMEWGYGWELGPYSQFDALGIEFLRSSFAERGLTQPALLQTVHEGFYRRPSSGTRQLTLAGDYAPIEPVPDHIDPASVRARTGEMEANADAALLDLGDGVLLLEFRAKMNTLGAGVMQLLHSAQTRITRDGYAGLVIGNADPRTFTAGANLATVLQQAREEKWKDLDAGIRAFQQGVTSLRRVPFPIVVAPFGLTLGGGAELVLHAARVQAHAESYIGLVEVGVGLLPGGGGTKELLCRFTRDLGAYEDADLFDGVKRAFKLITMATTSTSAFDAKALGLLRESDRISMNRDRLLTDAKARVLDLAPDYVAPGERLVRVLGREALGNLRYAVWSMREAGYITAHEVTIAGHVANVLAGGDGPPREATEADLLDLEREAFLSLLGTAETQERIAHTLQTGKPLRN